MNYKNGSIIGAHNISTPLSVSGVFNLNAVQEFTLENIFPAPFTRSGSSDSNHVHAINLNTSTLAPNIHYIQNNAQQDTGNYSIKDFTFTSGSSANHTIYIGNKINANTSTFHNDLCLGAIQVLEGTSGLVLVRGATNTTGVQTTRTANTNTDPTGLTYFDIVESTVVDRWNIASATASSGTGAADGISSNFQSGLEGINQAGEAVIAQASSTNFIYNEASGAALDEITWLKLPTTALATNTSHTLIIAYHLSVTTNDTLDDADDEMAIYIEN